MLQLDPQAAGADVSLRNAPLVDDLVLIELVCPRRLAPRTGEIPRQRLLAVGEEQDLWDGWACTYTRRLVSQFLRYCRISGR